MRTWHWLLSTEEVMGVKAWGSGAMVVGGPHTAAIRSRAGALTMAVVARVAIMAIAQHPAV